MANALDEHISLLALNSKRAVYRWNDSLWTLLGQLRAFTTSFMLLRNVICPWFAVTTVLRVLSTARDRLGCIELNRRGVGPALTYMLRGSIVRNVCKLVLGNIAVFMATNLLNLDVCLASLRTEWTDVGGLNLTDLVYLVRIPCRLVKHILRNLLLDGGVLSIVTVGWNMP